MDAARDATFRCYLATRVFCPMIRQERDGDHCGRCSFSAGIDADNGRVAVLCMWTPKDADELDNVVRLVA